jgi:hypothetical protein
MVRTLLRHAAVAACGLAFAATVLAPTGAAADTVVAIHFPLHQTCWRYTGTAFTFQGSFKGGQRLAVTATGDADMGNGRTNWVETEARDVDVSTVNGGHEVAAAQDGSFLLPATGAYEISLYPMAIRGNKGTVVICTV